MLKDATTEELLRGIRAVLAENLVFDTQQNNHAAQPDDPFGDEFARRLNLTFREVEIIQHIREGLSTEQIADRLHVAHETIKTHRKNIYFKLGINKVTELIQFAVRNGL